MISLLIDQCFNFLCGISSSVKLYQRYVPDIQQILNHLRLTVTRKCQQPFATLTPSTSARNTSSHHHRSLFQHATHRPSHATLNTPPSSHTTPFARALHKANLVPVCPPLQPLRKKDDPPTGEAAEGEEDVRLLCRRRRLWQPASPVILRVPPKCIFSLSTNQIPSETSNFDADVSIEDVTSKESLITSVVDIDSKLSCYNQHEIYTNCLSKCSALSTNRRASQLWTDCEHLYNCFYINNKFVLLISVCTLTSLLVLSLKKESDVIKKNWLIGKQRIQ